MKKSDIYEITIKIIGIYLFATSVIHAIDGSLSAFTYAAQLRTESSATDTTNWTEYLVLLIANPILLASFAAFLFLKANYIVKKVCSPSDFEENAKLFAEPKVIYEIALIITALLLIIWTLPDFGYQLRNYFQMEHERMFSPSSNLKYLWVSAAKIIIGIFLLLLARQLSEYFGRKNKQEENSGS